MIAETPETPETPDPETAPFDTLMAEVTASAGRFGHREHVHLTWLAVRRFGMPEALRLLDEGIRRTAREAGVPEKYHATVTRAWVELVAHHTHRSGADDSIDAADFKAFTAFAEGHPDLLDKHLLDRFYRPGTLATPRAKTEWTEPDLGPFPWHAAGDGADLVDVHRRNHGFRTLAEMAELARTNTVFDLGSTLIAKAAEIGPGNTFYPGVVVRCDGGECVIGRDNTFYPSTILIAEAGGRIRIGDGCTFGPGGVQFKANRPGIELSVGDRVRVLNGAEVVGSTTLGTGSQIIGAVAAQGVHLAAGDDFQGPDPDARGAVLKGFGLARGTRLGTGDVVNGSGDFASAPVERQLAYHPRTTG
ncbi:hypothetical protein [Streptomyces sp. NPDC059874]|uniref:hypothetical protein n=1 Tax=Streptomyces sp. NPDC059874 TaxID=3346983 RepID=UPI00364BC64A